MKNKGPKTISFEYKISPNYNMFAVSGIIGGLNARGEIVVNFFSERHAIPQKQTYELNPDGTLKFIEDQKKDSVIRDIPFGLSMPPSVARAVAKWLNDKADQYEKILASSEQDERENNE